MFDFKKLDTFFAQDSINSKKNISKSSFSKRIQLLRWIKLLLPAIAAILAGLLVLLPSLSERNGEFQLNIKKPNKGELEKLHMENTVFYITDENNRVNNLIAQTIDETQPGSKLIKLTNPEGLLPTDDDLWISVKAPIGFYDQNKNLLTLEQTVNMVYSDGMKATTEKMYYDANLAKAYANTDVHANGYFGSLDAQGFEYFKDKKMIKFLGNCKIIIHQNNNGD